MFSDAGELHRLGDGIYMLRLWANVCFIEATEGMVVFDVGLPFNGPRIVREMRSFSDKPVLYVIYGHGHADHAFGVEALLEDARERGHPRPRILAHANLPRRFDRYRRMLPYHERINRVQFGIPEGIPAFPWRYVYPDEVVGEEKVIRLRDLTLRLRHAKGETDDHLWMHVPELGVACVSDLWVWSCPNVGNPFKVQRYALDWARALEEVASCSPRLMLPGHGAALEGEERIGEACREVAEALRYLDGQVVEMLNRGMWQEDILHGFQWPEEYATSPYLQPIYGHPYFIVQALLRQYHGWYDGNPSHLFPAREAEVASQVLEMSGGAQRVLERARSLAGAGKRQLALHLVDFVIQGGVELRREAMELKAELLEDLASGERSLIARNIFLGGAGAIRRSLEGG